MQYPGVVDGAQVVAGQAENPGDPDADQRAAKPVLERLASGKVSGQGEAARGLGEPERVSGRGRLARPRRRGWLARLAHWAPVPSGNGSRHGMAPGGAGWPGRRATPEWADG